MAKPHNRKPRKVSFPKRYSCRWKEVARFLVVGVLNTGLTYAVYLGALVFFSYSFAYAISFVAGLAFTAFANVALVFGKKLTLPSVASYAGYYIGYYYLNLFGLSIAIERANISSSLAPLFVLPITIPIHYGMSKILLARF
jgi:putative flippase GtrA